MPPKVVQDSAAIPEAKGLKYDESEMALFHAKLSYYSTIDERKAKHDNNLASISDAQVKLIKRWEMLKQAETELADKGESLSPFDKRQLAQCAWRFNELEKLASKIAAG